MNAFANLELSKYSKFREISSLITNTLKVAWYPVANFISVLILTDNNAFESNMTANIVFLFVQGLLNLVIIQPTITQQPDIDINWKSLSIVRYILGILIIVFNSYYALFVCSVILIDTYSKISLKYKIWIYVPGVVLLTGLFFINDLSKFEYWYLASAIFFVGKASTNYMLTYIRKYYKNSLSVFFQWFYTVGYLIALSQISNDSNLSEVRAIQVFFGLSTMVVALLEFNALKNKLPKTTALRFLVPIGIALFSLWLKNDIIIVLSFCISSIIYMLSMDIAIRVKSLGNFWAINLSHRYAFIFQLLMLSSVFALQYYFKFDSYLTTFIIIMIVGPNIIFYQKAKSICKSY